MSVVPKNHEVPQCSMCKGSGTCDVCEGRGIVYREDMYGNMQEIGTCTHCSQKQGRCMYCHGSGHKPGHNRVPPEYYRRKERLANLRTQREQKLTIKR